MTKEELKQEAEAEADKVIIGSGMDRASVIHLKHLLVTMYLQGATKVTKELETQIEKMKCCGNCKNEGDYKEPYRYGTGWCNICKRNKVAKGNFDKWEIKEK